MTRALILTAAVAPLLLAGAAQAQTHPLPPGPSAFDQHRYQADQHRYEMDRLRMQADQRDATTRQIELDSRLTRMELERRRDPAPYVTPYAPTTPRALRSPDEERSLRESATDRRRAMESSVGEIDAWLDRRPN
jgi:hypothetical protein